MDQPPKHPSPPAIPPIGIVVSRYNTPLTERLLAGAREAYAQRGGDPETLGVIEAPGAFELAALCLAAAHAGLYEGLVALGCVIRGQTDHDRYIASAIAHGLVDVTLQTGVPVSFGVITASNDEQAAARAGGDKGNKGTEAMAAVLDTIASAREIARAADRRDPAGVRPVITRQIAKLGRGPGAVL